jgi:hypothetical protein
MSQLGKAFGLPAFKQKNFILGFSFGRGRFDFVLVLLLIETVCLFFLSFGRSCPPHFSFLLVEAVLFLAGSV